jgi:peptidylprolyl isomerase
MLVFDVELLDIIEGVAPIPAPDDVAAAPEDATKTESGLAYKQLEPGTGDEHPNSWDEVEVNYTGWTTDGQMFDSSTKRGKPARFLLNKVIPGWTEGVQLMKEGEKARFWIPEDLAYSGRPGAPKGTLVFDIELLKINEKPEPPPAPKNVAAPPKNAKKTDSGLAYLRLEKGKGNKKPEATDRVEVHYTGWTADGKMFDSSVVRGKTTTFPLNRVIPGWTEGLQLMTEGEKARLWIPEELAYKGRPGAPKGMLVFDVELVKILDAKEGAAASPHGNPAAAAAAKQAAMQAAAKKAGEQAAAKKAGEQAAAKQAAEKPADEPPADKPAQQPAEAEAGE